jgi:hypothetical protein
MSLWTWHVTRDRNSENLVLAGGRIMFTCCLIAFLLPQNDNQLQITSLHDICCYVNLRRDTLILITEVHTQYFDLQTPRDR